MNSEHQQESQLLLSVYWSFNLSKVNDSFFRQEKKDLLSLSLLCSLSGTNLNGISDRETVDVVTLMVEGQEGDKGEDRQEDRQEEDRKEKGTKSTETQNYRENKQSSSSSARRMTRSCFLWRLHMSHIMSAGCPDTTLLRVWYLSPRNETTLSLFFVYIENQSVWWKDRGNEANRIPFDISLYHFSSSSFHALF